MGMTEPLRVTTNPIYLEEQPESAELWSPGSPLFPEAPYPTSVEDTNGYDGGRLSSILADSRNTNTTDVAD